MAASKQGDNSDATPHRIYEAWMLLGKSHRALEHWDAALSAFEQAALQEPLEVSPRLAAADVDKVIGRNDAAIICYQQALAIVNGMKPPPEGARQSIYEGLIALLEAQKRSVEADRYQTLRKEQMAESARLTLLGVEQAIRKENLVAALDLAGSGVASRPEDPLAFLAVGRAQRASKDAAKAIEAYRKAFEMLKDAPVLQIVMAEYLLRTGDPADAAEAEKALRDLVPRNASASLLLVGILEQRGKADEALEVAQSGVRSHPKDSTALVALGSAWWGKKENTKAETAFKEAVQLSPADAPVPTAALLEFYARTDQKKLAKDMLQQILLKSSLPEVDRELLRGKCLAVIGDREAAKDAYHKAVEASKEDPVVQMRLAEFLLDSSKPADLDEAERVLRGIVTQHDPARRRLAEVLVKRGGEAEWEEAQRLLELSAGDSTPVTERFDRARSLLNRGGPENLTKAATICQALLAEAEKTKQPIPGAYLLLARIRERQDNLEDARKQYRAMVEPGSSVPCPVSGLYRFPPAARTG